MMVYSIHIDCQNILFIKENSVKIIVNIIDHVCILRESPKCEDDHNYSDTLRYAVAILVMVKN